MSLGTAQRFVDALIDTLDADMGGRPRHTGMRRAVYALAGFALVTAASAGISSVRDRLESSSGL